VSEKTTHVFKAIVIPLVIGLLAGLSSGLFGVGGGFIMVPLFVYLMKLDQKRAHATSLAAVVPIAFVGALGYGTQGNVVISAAAFVLAGSIIGATYGARLLQTIALPRIQILFAAILIATAIRLVWSVAPTQLVHGLSSHVFLFGVGLASGVLSGLLGVGGGLFVVPALITATGLSSLEARGTGLAAIVGTALGGAITHVLRGNVEIRLAVLCGLSGIPGAFLGVIASHDVSESIAVRALAVLIVFVAVQQLRSARRGLAAV